MRVGRTISEERERIESESDRLAARELKKQREAVQTAILVVSVVALVILGVISAKNFFTKTREADRDATPGKVYAPSVEVIDESGAKLSKKMSEYIGMAEEDFQELGYTVTRVAIPAGMMREVDVYVRKNDGGDESATAEDAAAGNGELPYYFKLNIDRGSAVSAEDAVRMVRYLEERNLTPAYVDVRVEGKAFYR